MPLCGVSDLRQGICLLWFGANNLHTEEFFIYRGLFFLVAIARERIEVCVPIVNIHAFRALQFVHDEVR